MWAMEVGVVQPRVELENPFFRVLVRVCVGPLTECGLDEAFGFSVGARGVGPGEAMLDVLAMKQLAEQPVFITGAVVGQHSSHGEAEASVVSSAHEEEAHGRAMTLIRQESGEGDAAVVVDGDVQILVADAR